MRHELSIWIEPLEGLPSGLEQYRVGFSLTFPDGRVQSSQQLHPPTMLYEFIQGHLNNNLRGLLNELELQLKKQQKGGR